MPLAFCFHDTNEEMLKLDFGEVEAILRELKQRYSIVEVLQFNERLDHRYIFENKIRAPRHGWQPQKSKYSPVIGFLKGKSYDFACVFTNREGIDIEALTDPEQPVVIYTPRVLPESIEAKDEIKIGPQKPSNKD